MCGRTRRTRNGGGSTDGWAGNGPGNRFSHFVLPEHSRLTSGRTMCAPTRCISLEECFNRTPPIADSPPLTGRQPELVNRQSPESDARRTFCSRGAAILHLQACPRIPRRGHAGGITEKGVQNRRFWCVFGYFCHKTKVTAGPGCASPGYRIEPASPCPGVAEKPKKVRPGGPRAYQITYV